MEAKRVDVVIPTYYPGSELETLLRKLAAQSVPLRRILLINTEEAGFRAFLAGVGETEADFLSHHPLAEVYHIAKEEFDHGATRDLGMTHCDDADYVVFMTQDAEPCDETLIEALLAAFGQQGQHGERVAVSYARQLARPDATVAEKATRAFNYPERSAVKTEADFPRLGIKTYFCSNVCACYDRQIYREEGPFFSPAIFNEDMIYAGRLEKRGFAIAYAAEARVWHSHRYTAGQQFRRSFDIGVSQAACPEVFRHTASESEGKSYAKTVLRTLWKERAFGEILPFVWTSFWRFLGFRLGKGYENLPQWVVRRCTMNPGYFRKGIAAHAAEEG